MTSEPGRPVNLAVCKKSLIAYYTCANIDSVPRCRISYLRLLRSGLYDDDLSKLTAQWWSYFDARTPNAKDVIMFVPNGGRTLFSH